MSFRALLDGAKKLAINGPGSAPAPSTTLFEKVDPQRDGDDCLHDCASCTIQYPRSFKIDHSDTLYGLVKGWSTHVLVATSKTDWVRDVADEKGSVMQAIDRAAKPTNGKLMLSASNFPTPSETPDYAQPTRVLLLPAFVVVDNVTPDNVPALLRDYVSRGPTNTLPLAPIPFPLDNDNDNHLRLQSSPHSVLVLLCSQKTRDARCGQSAPLLRKELERHLRPLGLARDLDDERPGGVGIYFISHVGGHKYSANMMVYRRPNAFGIDDVRRADLTAEEKAALPARIRAAGLASARGTKEANGNGGEKKKDEASAEEKNEASAEEKKEKKEDQNVGASQCIWLARVMPEDCENLVKYTILQGKVVKPETQLRGGFDREKGLLSW